jgi:DNA transposition AAA+ family ATPase
LLGTRFLAVRSSPSARERIRFDDKPARYKQREKILEDCIRRRTKRLTKANDPTRLIIVDEADRLKVTSLEQMRSIFDDGGIGLVLIGMPGLEKRLARYPQLYSRVGFVHEFRPLSETAVRKLLGTGWSPEGVNLPDGVMMEEQAIAAILRITGGNFRFINRLLTQIARIMEINTSTKVASEVVQAARESLMIGTT